MKTSTLLKLMIILILTLITSTNGMIRCSKEMELTWKAICWQESRHNPKAYNEKEDAAGIAQIRMDYLFDVNEYLGGQYFLSEDDRYDVEASKFMFIKYMLRYNANCPERWARTHNGGPRGPWKKSTMKYWKEVKELMKTKPWKNL